MARFRDHDTSGDFLSVVLIVLGAAACCAFPFFGACNVSDSTLDRVLGAEGFTDVHPGAYAWFACGKGDTFASQFTATNPAGKPVAGVVCCGLLKSCTVRF